MGSEKMLQLIMSLKERVHEMDLRSIPREVLDTILSANPDPTTTVNFWIGVLQAESARSWLRPDSRCFALLCAYRAFEIVRRENYRALAATLRERKSLSGRPMNVIGTKCNIGTRTAEALYSEARRNPRDTVSKELLEVVDQLLDSLLTECREREDPAFARRWYGIRGTTRLMLATQQDQQKVVLSEEAFANAASDLETAFRLGNRGPSAATFLLDALRHLSVFDKTDATLKRTDKIISALAADERHSRGTAFHIGLHHFARGMRENDRQELQKAVTKLDESLTYPQTLSFDDAFIRLNRGQVYVRLAMMNSDSDPQIRLSHLNAGIGDLKFAFEANPEKFGNHAALPSALQSRADEYARLGRYEDAQKDLLYALDPTLRNADLKLASQVDLKRILYTLRPAADHGADNALRLLEEAVTHPAARDSGHLYIALSCRKIFQRLPRDADNTALMRTIQLLRYADTHSFNNEVLIMHLSVLAGLQALYAERSDLAYLQEAVDTYTATLAVPVAAPPVELLSTHGNACLRLAKYYLSEGTLSARAGELLEDAADLLTRACDIAERDPETLSEGFQLVVTYSKAGEANLRLAAFSGSKTAALDAIAQFERAKDLGNETPELWGLLGDAYYRAFRVTKDIRLLEKSLDCKQSARDAGAESRENLSLSAKLSFTLYEYSNDEVHLAGALRLVGMAHTMDTRWPWPPFQLAEIHDRVDDESFAKAVSAARSLHPSVLFDFPIQGLRPALMEYGTQLVLDSDEFTRKRLSSGRQVVFVMEDPHGILSSSFVFKTTDGPSAARDREAVLAFAKFLSQRGTRDYRLPDPLAIIKQQGSSVIYLMRRARGHDLGRAVIRAKIEGREPPVNDFHRALRFLAAYHAWDSHLRGMTVSPVSPFVIKYLTSLGIHKDQLPSSTVELLLTIGRIPHTVKKDAHPENWLIDDYGNICMIDFESRKTLPILFEVAQLIEDYPLLPTNRDGWEARMRGCDHYLDQLTELLEPQIDLAPDVREQLYAVFSILRAGFGLQYCLRPHPRRSSSSAVRALSLRITHYVALLEWFSAWEQEAVSDLARLIRMCLGPSELPEHDQ